MITEAVTRSHNEAGTTTVTGGIGLPGVLFIVFLVLKLTGHITFSWWWVTSPLWISAGLVLVILLVAILVVCLKR